MNRSAYSNTASATTIASATTPPAPEKIGVSVIGVSLVALVGGFVLRLTPHDLGWYVKYRTESVGMEYRPANAPESAPIASLVYQPHREQNITLQKTILGLSPNAVYDVRFSLETIERDVLFLSAWQQVKTLPAGAAFA